jgi:hypothetical protein
MKIHFVKSLTALLTFLIGIGVFLGYWNFRLENVPQAEVAAPMFAPVPVQTTFCEIADNQNLNGKLVIFEATAYVIYDGTIILHPDNCNFRGETDLFFAELELDAYFGKLNNLKTLLEGKNKESRDDFKEVDVKVTGTAKIITKANGYKIYSITPIEIEIISPFRKFTPKGAA